MKRTIPLALILGLAFIGASPVLAQDIDHPPVIDAVTFSIQRNLGGNALPPEHPQGGPYAPIVPFDPGGELAHELDWVYVLVVISDEEWIPDPNDPNAEVDDVVYILHQTLWLPVQGYPTPEPPPVGEDIDVFFPENDGLGPNGANGDGNPAQLFEYRFQIPTFVGENQAKLRGLISYDVVWLLNILVSDQQDPGCPQYSNGFVDWPCDDFATYFRTYLFAIENPALAAPNPPVFADAGPDRTVPFETDITLDASGTFDGFNVGFDLDSEHVFFKDDLIFTWEWVSGPERVDPVQADQADPTATVYFAVMNDPNDPDDAYEFKVTVSDQVNPTASTDSIRVRVVHPDDLINNMPVAKIVGPSETITVGSIITLCGRQSCDPDCDPDCGMISDSADDPCADPNLSTPCEDKAATDDDFTWKFRWQQVNELGGLLTAEQIVKAFQPLSDLAEPVTTWQAISPGEFYFRLLVDDGANVATDVITVIVLDTEAAAAAALNDEAGNAGGGSPSNGFAATPALCGAGLMSVAVVPLALCVMRRRLR